MPRSFSKLHVYTGKIEPQSLEAFMPDICNKRNNCLQEKSFAYNKHRLRARSRTPGFAPASECALKTPGIAFP